jgi:hypothetical protein
MTTRKKTGATSAEETNNVQPFPDKAQQAAPSLAEQGIDPTWRRPLAIKMARVMADVRHVPKNGRNSFHKYDYIMESDLVDRLRGKLSEQGVAVFPSIRDHQVTPSTDHKGKPQFLATVTLDITFIDGESGDQMTTTWVGQGVDQGDKSYYKAYTGAFKYALLKTFLVTPGDPDEDDYQSDDEPVHAVR